MAGKSLSYWREKYESSVYRQEDYKSKNGVDTGLEAAWKTLDLLSQYAAFYKHFIVFPMAWGGSIGRFFSCRCNTHHGNEVQNAIGNFFHMDGYYALTEEFQTVGFVLALVKRSMGDKDMNSNGDLARILQVVKEKTVAITITPEQIKQFKDNLNQVFEDQESRKFKLPGKLS